jgi:hypothetical protein
VMALISSSEPATLASLVATSLRKPCAEHSGRQASLHFNRNQLVKPRGEIGAPDLVTRNVRLVFGTEANASGNNGSMSSGISSGAPVLTCLIAMAPSVMCCQPIRTMSLRRCPVRSRAKASRALLPAR